MKSLNSNDPMIKHSAFSLIQQEIRPQEGQATVLQPDPIAALQETPSISTSAEMAETQEEETDEMEYVSSDVEDNSSSKRNTSPWPVEATSLLISVYKSHEEAMEDTSNKKKNVWADITKQMNNTGYKYTQNKIESKWRSLIKSHKLIKGKRSQTGAKRKTFQCFEQIDDIVSKRHDINPPYVQGTSSGTSKQTKFMAKHTSDDNDSSHEKLEKIRNLKRSKYRICCLRNITILKSFRRKTKRRKCTQGDKQG